MTPSTRPRAGWTLALLVLVFAGLGAALLWRELRSEDREQVRHTIALQAAGVRNEIASEVQSLGFALERMAHRWQVRGGPPREEWETDAALVVKHYRGIQAIGWVDGGLIARWVVPLERNEVIEGADLGIDPARRQMFETARTTGTIRVMRTFDLLEGHRGVVAAVPIAGPDGGFIMAVFQTQPTIDDIVKNLAPDYGISVDDGTDKIYFRAGASRETEEEWSAVNVVEFGGVTWKIQVWPLPDQLARLRSRLGDGVLLGGLSLSFLVALAVYLAQTSSLRADRLEQVNRALAHEIAVREEAERALAYLAAIVDSSDDAIVGCALDGTVVSWNAAAERVYGCSSREMRGRSIAVLETPEHAGELLRVVGALEHGDPGQRFETEHMRADGERIHVSLTVSAIRDAAGKPLGISLIARDISRRKRAEAELRGKLASLETSAEERNLSLATTSHDVRGALTSIAGYAELLAEEVAGENERAMANRIAALAHTLSEVMGDLLLFARDQHGTQLNLRTVPARGLIARTADDFRPRCTEKGLGFSLDLAVDGEITTDTAQFTRILQNLLSNAVRYTESGGVSLRGRLDERELHLVVSDTGIGIPETDLDRVWEEFYRTDRAKEMESLGTGLGLSTVKRLVHMLGGDVTVRSKVGEGTTFEVVLPRHSGSA